MENPDQRFWQALRNWSGHNFILVAKALSIWELDSVDRDTVKDTFYFEGKTE